MARLDHSENYGSQARPGRYRRSFLPGFIAGIVVTIVAMALMQQNGIDPCEKLITSQDKPDGIFRRGI